MLRSILFNRGFGSVEARFPFDELFTIAIADLLRCLYGLTRAEAVVAEQIIAGARPRAVAEALGVGIDTVRTHLKRGFAKAEVSSQTELTRIVLSAMGQLRHLK